MKNLNRLMVTLLALCFAAGVVACGDDWEDAFEDEYCATLEECDEDAYDAQCDVDEDEDEDEDEEGEELSDECEDAMIEYYECVGGLDCDDYDDHVDFETEDSPCDAEQEAQMDACS